jgi:3-deoxy-D-manno-octulosonic-acid transferase
MFFFYSLLFFLVLVLGSPYFLFQAFAHRKYLSSFPERLGFLPKSFRPLASGGIWVHAVSVGELLAVLPLLKKIRNEWPSRDLFVTTTTLTGQTLARQRLDGEAHCFYFPIDWAFCVRRVLAQIRPGLVVIAETEIWPNFLRECQRNQIPVVLVNGRISDKSIHHYRRIRWVMRRVLPMVSFCCMRGNPDRERILELGAPPERVAVCGNLKFDLSPAKDLQEKSELFRRLFSLQDGDFVLVAGSTLAGEEEGVLEAFRSLREAVGGSILILAPRHPERFQEVAGILEKSRLRYVRRSQLSPDDNSLSSPRPEVIFLDTLGELASVYSLAQVVFVGGSLVPKGGHNILEPALFEKPVLFGPFMSNFQEMADRFVQEKAGMAVTGVEELQQVLRELALNRELRQSMGAKGFKIIQENRGAAQRILECLKPYLNRPDGRNIDSPS